MSARGIGAPALLSEAYPTPPHVVARLVEVCPEVQRAIVLREPIYEIEAGEGLLRPPTPEEEASYTPPRRVITVSREAWGKLAKKAPPLREEMLA